MTRPLIISDCDEVILHMVVHFKEWLEESQGVNFEMKGGNFGEALSWQDSGKFLEAADVWRLLGGFFDTEMDRQLPITGAVDALNSLSEHADVVVLTNLVDFRRDHRTEQLAAHGLNAKVYTNQGPKGPALAKIVEEFAPANAIFIDDLAQHHASVKEVVPHVTRLHLCGEPLIADDINCAHKEGNADARIDQWSEALPWLMQQLEGKA
ncbi:HAD family hydrolase [uncultured Erythrobacter sp.]|uniref:HAD family hydrolase n=1 Tax=uncultured Erythrobacter sp. TaxID=263913 RepID=UPI00261B1824|nr:HAD family hydrolase [uncultured Erythrobacter sp.]